MSSDRNPDIIYLDNAATTYPKPACVYEAADTFYRNYGGNAGRGANPFARRGTELIAETRQRLAVWLDASSTEAVIFTPSATIALNLAILGTNLRPGDVIYVTPFEHNSVLRPVEHLRQTLGVEVREIPFDRQVYACQLDRLATMFRTAPPALVCVTQASNVCGLMPPVAEIVALARRVQGDACVIVVDGAQTAGLYPLDLKSGLIDAFIFSGHKSLYGPFGAAGLVLSSAWRPTPLLFGGTGTYSESVAMPEELPSIYEAGSHNIWAIAGLNAALEWLHETGREAILTHTLELAEQLRNELSRLQRVQVYAPPNGESWCGILSFTIDGVRPQAIEAALGAKGIAVRAGLHCAPWTHRWLGTIDAGGTVRISVGHLNEIAQLEEMTNGVTMLIEGV